jgi:hypothetical protein
MANDVITERVRGLVMDKDIEILGGKYTALYVTDVRYLLQCADELMAMRANRPCTCGAPKTDAIHRTDGPCYRSEVDGTRTPVADVIPADEREKALDDGKWDVNEPMAHTNADGTFTVKWSDVPVIVRNVSWWSDVQQATGVVTPQWETPEELYARIHKLGNALRDVVTADATVEPECKCDVVVGHAPDCLWMAWRNRNCTN